MSPTQDALQLALASRYDVQGELGRGGMATVYRAHDLRHDRAVAIKLLSPELSATLGADRFLREIQIAARLSHPHILPVYDSGEAGGLLYYVMPLVTGESLRQRIERERQLPLDDAMRIACEVADALAAAHSRGVVHRDIKPENILLSGGHAVVADFGIARIMDAESGDKLTATGMSVGTAAYMSPEQFSGQPVDGRGDIYSLGCVLYEMLVGETPFTGPNMMAIVARASVDPVPSIRVVRPAVPEELEAVVLQALEKVPADRFRTMQELKEALLGGETSTFAVRTTRYSAVRQAPAPRSTGAPWSQPRGLVLLAAVLIAIVVTAGISWRSFTAPEEDIRQAGSSLGPAASNLAVLYFDDLSRDGELRYVADGITESLIDRLAEVPALRVVSANGVEPYRDGTVSRDSIMRALQVGSLVRGQVEPSARGARITVALVDPSGSDAARRTFDMQSDDPMAAMDSVTGQVSRWLRGVVGEEAQLRTRRRETDDAHAWSLVQQAERERKRSDSLLVAGRQPAALSALLRGDSLLAAAQQRDPRWPEPPALRAALAYRHARALRADPASAAPVVQAGLAHAESALARDPRSAAALEQRGSLRYLRHVLRLAGDDAEATRTLAGAEQDLLRAVEIDRSRASAYAMLSILLYRKPDIPGAAIRAQQAYEADAYLANADAILTRLFWTNYDNQAFPEAQRWCAEGQSRFPRNPFFTECALWMLTTKQAPADPAAAWRLHADYRGLLAGRDSAMLDRKGRMLVAAALGRAGMPDSARAVLLDARARRDVDPHADLPATEAIVRVMLGDLDEAVDRLSEYGAANPTHLKGFATGTGWWWLPLQEHGRFRRLMTGLR